MGTIKAIEIAQARLRSCIQASLDQVAPGVPGNQRFRNPARRAVLDKNNLISPMFMPCRNKFPALMAQPLILQNIFPFHFYNK